MSVIDAFCDLYADLARIDLNDLENVYASDVVFIDPITTHRGLTDVKAYFAQLLERADHCRFDIHKVVACEHGDNELSHIVNWTMYLQLSGMSQEIVLPGTTQLLVQKDHIVYHRDYYDMGKLVYEHIPVLGWFIRKIKSRLSL